jgi:predicted transcriptional regulator
VPHATLSTSVDERVATRLRDIAKREDRSTSSMIANALGLYTLMPKEMRETLRLFAGEDEAFLRDVLNEMSVLAVRRKFDFARRELSKTTRTVPEMEGATEADIADMALAIGRKL